MKILLVEDYGPLRISLRDRLKEDGYLVDEACDTDAAYDRLVENSYALVILDLMLPGGSGFELLEFIRSGGLDTAVMIITARDNVFDRVTGLDKGADDYLVKPFALEEAAARVRALLRRRYQNLQTVISVADLVVDLNGSVAKRDGKDISLTAKEFALLRLLAQRRGRMVSRAEIWEEIYETGGEGVASNVVTVTISRLRKKIDGPGQIPLIHTHRGLGYVLSEITPSDG